MNPSDSNQSDLVPLTGLWLEKAKDGSAYMAGKLAPKCKVFIFKNKYKRKGSNDPDYKMYFGKIEPRDTPLNGEPHKQKIDYNEPSSQWSEANEDVFSDVVDTSDRNGDNEDWLNDIEF